MLSFLIVLILSLCYVALAAICLTYWRKEEDDAVDSQLEFSDVSIIVIARNEADNIANCLLSIKANDYPEEKYEIILVDDHSQDDTVTIAEDLNIANLHIYKLEDHELPDFDGANKKAGQFLAIQKAKHEIILQTDGDCICPQGWIKKMSNEMDSFALSTGIIGLYGKFSWLSRWQILDNILTMMGTMAGINSRLWYSGNAANMVYRRTLYEHFIKFHKQPKASGDDIFLVNYAAHTKQPVSFVRDSDAIVKTNAEDSWTGFLHQRKRWASKATDYRWNGLKMLTAFIFTYQLGLLLFFIIALIDFSLWPLFVILLLTKIIVDNILLRRSVQFYNDSIPWTESFFYSLCHAVYVLVIGTMSLFSPKFIWKGRKVS